MVLPGLLVLSVNAVNADDEGQYRQWIQAMKQSERGPFTRIRWFCADGTVLPPEPYACREHGGGRQHGEYSVGTMALREAGYFIANVLTALPPEEALADNAARLKWVLLEQFLRDTDDGWILRRARYYRGALQSEGEQRAARDLLKAMLDDNRYRTTHFLLLREAARLLPWRAERNALDTARGLATTIAAQDPGFTVLRNKIHSYPEHGDTDLVRAYLAQNRDPELQERLHDLHEALLQTFRNIDLAPGLRRLAASINSADATAWSSLASGWEQAITPEQRLANAARILAALRESLNTGLPAGQRLVALELSLAAEHEAFVAGQRLLRDSAKQSRHWQMTRLLENLDVLYGVGFLTRREYYAQRELLASLEEDTTITLADYRYYLDYLARIPSWAYARFSYFFRPQISHFSKIEPRIEGFIPDRLRGSPLLLHGQLLEQLMPDADRLAGIRHEVFGQAVSLGLRALNPGMARGPLQRLPRPDAETAGGKKPIVLVSETTADLPPVAGIITAREGNTLSHVQLLARNLGLPNVVAGPAVLPILEQWVGEQIVLLASPGGVVHLYPDDAVRWNPVFPESDVIPAAIRPNLDKLELDHTGFIALEDLRASDSGRSVGPKAARLGELKTHFPNQIAPGLVIPFGQFRDMLMQPLAPDGQSLFEWMHDNYARLKAIDNPAIRQRETMVFLNEVRSRIEHFEFSTEFRQDLREQMEEVFGPEGSYGVFVRSDTNVEDLPGFTGAGLNRTVFNVVGFEQVLDAIKTVWASPFTERAYGWRQALMEQPEHVYVAVLLHQTVPAEKSGVMVTADITNNSPGIFSIAVNEGAGGGVDGQAAESLKVDINSGAVRLLAIAAEPCKWDLPATGGAGKIPASGADRVLTDVEINQLIAFGRELPERYPVLLDNQGQPVPADIEFAFAAGRLYLNQIRPFLQSERMQRNRILSELDGGLQTSADVRVDLAQIPLAGTP